MWQMLAVAVNALLDAVLEWINRAVREQ